MKLDRLLDDFDERLDVTPRPYVNHAVAFKRPTSRAERAEALERAGLNAFFFPAELVTGCDLLSDSGTTAMTQEQWGALHLGDEAYGSNRGYFRLAEAIRETFGSEFFHAPHERPHAFLFHQGRAAEDALFTLLGRTGKGLIVPSNGHFDTTFANLEANGITARNLFSPELRAGGPDVPFKGNMDVAALKELLENEGARVPLVYLTITNNTGGGQPVSLENVREVAELAHAYDVPFFLDACRFAENAWFVREREEGCAQRAIPDLVRATFAHADGFTVSFKKDGLGNMGGGLFVRRDGLFAERHPELLDALTDWQILTEGHPTYGGMSGRDLVALAVGLRTVVRPEYLRWRVEQVGRFGAAMAARGLPVLEPIGGHAVYLDVDRFLADTALEPGDFGGIALVAALLAGYGHRACELGHFAFGRFDPRTKAETPPEVNFIRFAVPRLRYEDRDLESVAAAVKAIHERRDRLPAVEVTYGRALPLRHFKARFRFR